MFLVVATGQALVATAQAHAQVPVPVPGRRDTTAQPIAPREVRGARTATVVGGAAVQTLKLDSLRTSIAPSLAEVLRTVPLVLVRTNSRGEVELSVRGSESRQVGIMLNGLPLSPGWDGRADPSLIPLSGISELTYVRATSSVLGGPNTLGGVIDLRVDHDARALTPRLSLGSDETGARLASGGLAASTAVGAHSRLSWRLGGGIRELDGIVRARGVPDPIADADLRTNTDVRSKDLFGALAWRAENGAGLSALVTGYDMSRGVAPELHLSAPRLWRYPRQSRRATQLRAQSPLWVSGGGTTELELSGGWLDGTTDIQNFTDATFTTVNGTEEGRELVSSARFAATQSLPSGTQFRAAVTANRVRYDETIGTAAASRYRQSLLSAGLETQWVAGTRTLLSGGVVYDRAETIEAGGRPPLGRQDHIGWRLGATVQTAPRTKFHASASRRARFPALRELYSGALNRFEPNPALRPEQLLAAEAGVSFGHGAVLGGVSAQVTAFHHWLKDGVVRVGVPNTNRFTRVNRDETRTVGAEVLLGWSAPAGGPSLTLDLVAQRVTIRDLIAGGTGRKPEHMPGFRAMLDGTVPTVARLSAGANVSHIGSQFCVNPELGRDVALAAQTVGGVSLQRSWGLGTGHAFRALRVLASMDNVTNAAAYEQCGLPRAGRTLRLGVDLR